MKKLLNLSLVIASATLFVAVSTAKATDTVWTDFTSKANGNTYNADTLGSDFSSATVTTTVSDQSVPTGGGDPGNWWRLAGGYAGLNNHTLTFTLDANGNINLNTLDFNFEPSGGDAPLAISWTYSVAGGGSGSLGSSSISAPSYTWGSDSLSLSGIGTVDSGQVLTIIGTLNNTYSGLNTATLGFDNFDFNDQAVGGSSVPDSASTAELLTLGMTALIALRRKFRA